MSRSGLTEKDRKDWTDVDDILLGSVFHMCEKYPKWVVFAKLAHFVEKMGGSEMVSRALMLESGSSADHPGRRG